MPLIHGRAALWSGRPPDPTCRFVHSWVHSWGQSSIGVVTPMLSRSHPSQDGRSRRSAATGPVPSLHTRWTTLGAERHVDLWTKRRDVHSVPSRVPVSGTREAPGPRAGTRASL